jgi:murein DD-endopeptidase MepM/ murein hydrolase activator NlpD
MKKFALAVIGVLLVALLASAYLLSSDPNITVTSKLEAVGKETPVELRVTSPHGVRRLSATLIQSGKKHSVYHAVEPARRSVFFRNKEQPRDFTLRIGTKQAPELKDGPARLEIEAVANDFAGATATYATDVRINTQPLAIAADGAQHYINQGGSELVTFTVNGYWTEAGVRVGKYTFRSFPIPGSTKPDSSERFSLFAFPWDVPADTVPVLYARNPTGEEATARFWFKVFPKQFRSRDLQLDNAFLQKVVSELDPGGSGEIIERFLNVNRDMRQKNNQELADLRNKTDQKLLWTGPFFRIGKVESYFADKRSYFYNGKKVDEQMHLGFDLSDVQASPVKAANAGRVVHAGPLGIYGNCIVVDHGYGLQSIYGHLRQIDVKSGDTVQKEQVMGRSGATGLAGGDHIHYSIQVDGVQVNPLEWWDEHWIKDRILSKLPAGKSSRQS